MFYISTSGGMGSAISALAAHHHGLPFRMVFADVLQEDDDLYRFLSDVQRAVGQDIIRLCDGRTPWDVFEDRKFIGNSRTAHCSSILKTDVVMEWMNANAEPDDPLVLGMDWSEQDRIDRAIKTWSPRPVVSLLNQLKVWRPSYALWLDRYGIKRPALYDLGFSHNNCGGKCVRQGLRGWATLLEKRPEEYHAVEIRMEAAMAKIGPTAKPFLKLRSGGGERYITLKDFRIEYQAGLIEIDPYADDEGACGCFTDNMLEGVE